MADPTASCLVRDGMSSLVLVHRCTWLQGAQVDLELLAQAQASPGPGIVLVHNVHKRERSGGAQPRQQVRQAGTGEAAESGWAPSIIIMMPRIAQYSTATP